MSKKTRESKTAALLLVVPLPLLLLMLMLLLLLLLLLLLYVVLGFVALCFLSLHCPSFCESLSNKHVSTQSEANQALTPTY